MCSNKMKAQMSNYINDVLKTSFSKYFLRIKMPLLFGFLTRTFSLFLVIVTQ